MHLIRYCITIILLLFSIAANAQNITLSDLFRYRKLPLSSVRQELRSHSWTQTVGSTFIKPSQQLSFYNARYNDTEHVVRYITKDDTVFAKVIRDSLEAYGYVPDTADERWYNDVYAHAFRWKSIKDTADERRILVKYRDSAFKGKMVAVSIFESRR